MMSVSVCVSVCLRSYIRNYRHMSDIYQFVGVTHGHKRVLFRQRCDMLCTSGFMHDRIKTKLGLRL